MFWLVLSASAAPPPAPPPAPVIEVVPAFVQGQVHVFLAGREGDQVFIDDFPFGVLPLTTELTEGPHKFRVEGAKGRHVADLEVKIAPGAVAELDLAPPPPPAPASP
jgi:hypothetical protein